MAVLYLIYLLPIQSSLRVFQHKADIQQHSSTETDYYTCLCLELWHYHMTVHIHHMT